MTEIRKEGDKYKAYTTMAKYEHMLMRMWKEIDGIYASNCVVLPLWEPVYRGLKMVPKIREIF